MSQQRRQRQKISKPKPNKRKHRMLAVFGVVTITFVIGLLFGQSCMDTRIVMPELPLDSLVLTPDSVTIPVGDSVQLTATLWAGGVIVGCSGDCVSIEVNSRIQNVFLALRDNRPVEIELQATTVGKHTILADGRPMLAINSIGRPILAIESSEKKLFFTTPAGRN